MSVALKLSLPETSYEAQVQVPKETLFKLGWRRVVATSQARCEDLILLFNELKQGGYSHTWKWFDALNSGPILNNLQVFENQRRPTHLFFYYGEKGSGERVFFAAGAVAEKICHSFSHVGFPVISRCYTLKNFRNNRFYHTLLRHRFEFCQQLFGPRLKGVHLGTSNPRVSAAIRKGLLKPNFLYVGQEELEGKNEIVDDFVAITENYKKLLLNCRGLKETFNTLFEGKSDETFYHQIQNKLRLQGSSAQTPEAQEFIDLLKAISVLEITKPRRIEGVNIKSRQGA